MLSANGIVPEHEPRGTWPIHLSAASIIGVVPMCNRCMFLVLVTALMLCGQGVALDLLNTLLPPTVGGNFDELVRVATATCEAIPLEILLTYCQLLEMPYTNMVEFRKGSRQAYRVMSAHEHIDTSLSTLVVYVPGWWNTPTDTSSTTIVKSLLKKHPLVLVLDTRVAFCRGYVTAVSKVNSLAQLLYNFIRKLDKKGFDISSVHIIGFSLGAHVAGMTGKLVQKNLNNKIGKITGLDPAKPCFTKMENRLHKRDADFVQVIHTSAGILGLEEPIGHVDVYVNGIDGKQPECKGRSITLECDHSQAWKVFSASVSKPLVGRRCASWEELVDKRCNGHEAVLGYSCSPKTRGIYLYKSDERAKPQESRVTVYNPFNVLNVLKFS